MKTIFLILLCVFVPLNIFSQSEADESGAEAAVEEISLARDDGSGKPGEATGSFTTADVRIHFLVNLSSTKPVTVKMNLVAANAGSLKPGEIVVTVSFKTNGKQNRVRFSAEPDEVWSAGRYRADVLIDGKTSGSREFEIRKSSKDKESEKQSPPKVNPKPEAAKRARKN